MMRAKATLAAAALLLLSACGEGDGGGDASDAGDAGQDGSAASDGGTDASGGDGDEPYRGVTQGGQVPDAPDYEEPEPDDGPFEVETTCCERTLSFDALAGETAATFEADSDVLDGLELTLEDDAFTAELCMPEATAIQYRLVVSRETDGGSEEVTRVDADEPTFEDGEGESWNVYLLESCE